MRNEPDGGLRFLSLLKWKAQLEIAQHRNHIF